MMKVLKVLQVYRQVIEEFGGDDGEGAQNSLPQSRECKVEQKKFYFDVGRNDRGVFLRLTEVIPSSYLNLRLVLYQQIYLWLSGSFFTKLDSFKWILVFLGDDNCCAFQFPFPKSGLHSKSRLAIFKQ